MKRKKEMTILAENGAWREKPGKETYPNS